MKKNNALKRLIAMLLCAVMAVCSINLTSYAEWEEDYGHEHSYSSKVTRQPTCAREGVRTYTCSCGEKYTKSIAKLSHSYKNSMVRATMSKDGAFIKTCSRCGNKQTTAIPRIYSVSLTATKFEFDDQVKTPGVIVKDRNGKKLQSGRDYYVTYSEGRTKIGEYSVTITFKGNYSGSTVRKFNIVLGKVKTISRIENVPGVGFKWEDVYGADGYEIFNYNAMTKKFVSVGKFDITNMIYSCVRGGYVTVKIRAYKMVDGKRVYGESSDSVRYYGEK